MKISWGSIYFFMFLVIVGKISGFGKDVALSYVHGASGLTDAFFISNSLTSLIYASVYVAIPVFVVPFVTNHITKEDFRESQENLGAAFQIIILISLFFSLFVVCFPSVLVNIAFPRISRVTAELAASYTRIMALTFVFSSAVGFFNAIQVVQEKRLSTAVVPLVNNLVFIISLFIFDGKYDFIYVVWFGCFAWGILALGNAFVCKYALKFRVKLKSYTYPFKFIIAIFVPAVMTFYIEHFNSYVSTFFASTLADGSVSILTYANKVNLIVVSLFVVLLNSYFFPKFAVLQNQPDTEAVNRYVSSVLSVLLALSIPAAVFLVVFSEEIISLMFERGMFTSADVLSVSHILAVLSFSLPLILIRDLINRVIYSFGNAMLPLVSLMVSITLHAATAFVLTKSLGLYGIALSFVVSTFFNVVLLLVFAKYAFGIRVVATSTIVVALSTLSVLIALCVVYIVDAYLDVYWVILCGIYMAVAALSCYLLYKYFSPKTLSIFIAGIKRRKI